MLKASIVSAILILVAFNGSAARATFIVLPDNAALNVSPDGGTVVGYNSGQASKWTAAGGLTPLNDPAASSGAAASSTNGAFIVGRRDDGSTIFSQAVRWTSTDSTILGDGNAHDVTPDGSVVVGRKDTGDDIFDFDTEPFRWTESGGMVGLGYLPGANQLNGAAQGCRTMAASSWARVAQAQRLACGPKPFDGRRREEWLGWAIYPEAYSTAPPSTSRRTDPSLLAEGRAETSEIQTINKVSAGR